MTGHNRQTHPASFIIVAPADTKIGDKNFSYSVQDKDGNQRGIVTSDTNLQAGQTIEPSDLTWTFGSKAGGKEQYHYTPRRHITQAQADAAAFDSARELVMW